MLNKCTDYHRKHCQRLDIDKMHVTRNSRLKIIRLTIE